MSDDLQVQHLLDALLESGSTPEEICQTCPELLPQIRERWRQVRRAQFELDALFPPDSDQPTPAPLFNFDGITLPTIDGYEVEQLLGRGGMGVVFRARHLRLNRNVALKMMLAGAYAGPYERERFQREAEAVAALRHPNIVQVYDAGESDGRTYFTMEYVDGGTLFQALAHKAMPARDSAHLLQSLAAAVHEAHTRGIIHRDLKPSNVLLTADGTAKISDFGLARRLDTENELTWTGAAIGTPSYMAPEQAAGRCVKAEPTVDVYALGAILYELLTGRPPFRGQTATETIHEVISKDPVPLSRLNPKVSPDLETICLKCLHKEHGLRYASADALRRDLERYLRGEAIEARPESSVQRIIRRIRRRPLFSFSLAIGSCVTIGLIGSGLWLLSNHFAAERQRQANHQAAQQAVEENLHEMMELMHQSHWSEARAALARAKAWQHNHESPELQQRVAQGEEDLNLVARLDDIRLNGHIRIGTTLSFNRSDEQYTAAFQARGLGHFGEPPEMVATRVKRSNICNALLESLDHWSTCISDAKRKRWVLDVTIQADHDTTGWRTRARDPNSWQDQSTLFRLIDEAPCPAHAVALLIAAEREAQVPTELHILFLKHLQQAYPEDFWTNLRLAQVLCDLKKSSEAVGYFQAALALRPDVAIVNHNLAMTLIHSRRFEDALGPMRKTIALDPANATSYANYANLLQVLNRHQEAIDAAQTSLKLDADQSLLHTILGKSREALHQPLDALTAHQRAVQLNPASVEAQNEYRGFLSRQRRFDELQQAWQDVYRQDPNEHAAWYGHAELCLFTSQEEDYLKARRKLLEKFLTTTDPMIAERTSRACLLRSASTEELNQAVTLADRAMAADRVKYAQLQHAFAFVKGLADYRQGHFAAAMARMKGEAAPALGPAPQLILAMAQYQAGQEVEARKTLVAAVTAHNWRPEQIKNQDDWIRHVLRREAETLIVPQLAAKFEGLEVPQDNDERFILIAKCQSASRFHQIAQLYEDMFTADPKLSQALGKYRESAARAAAIVGEGECPDAKQLNDDERATWRSKARQWLRAELADCQSVLATNPANKNWIHWSLQNWQETADFANLREPAELAKRTADEREECYKLWAEVTTLFNATGK